MLFRSLDGVLSGLLAPRAAWQVVENDRLDTVTIGRIAERSKADQECANNRQDNRQGTGKLLWVGHAAANGDDHSDTFVREHGCELRGQTNGRLASRQTLRIHPSVRRYIVRVVTCSNKQSKVFRVEQAQGHGRVLVEDKLLDIVGVQIDESDNDTEICNQRAEAQLPDIAHKGKGHQDHKEDGDPHNLI